MDFAEFTNVYCKRINLTLNHLINSLPFQNSSLVNAVRYGTLLGGKRLRPLLVYATGEMIKVNSDILDTPAAAVEFMHAYSLIHDDLPAMDGQVLRRDEPTCHIKYGEDIAILAGDALQTLAFSTLANQPMAGVNTETRLAMITELAQASGINGMCGGQALDLESGGKCINLINLEQIHRYKTGALIRAAVRLGALAAGNRGRAILLTLDSYANAIGLAFQVQDDILDITSNTAVLGKTKGTDQKLQKNTYPTLMGLHKARKKAYDLCQEALDALDVLAQQSYNTTTLKAVANFIIKRNK
ncbi:(2E,6E)-farnesyl diphosphate synthase [Candidatus Pantoea carbekii]|uniref:IspA protein n=1 Tax=Candidatus Pantoea carbekii TaxID=1235990 RepID=U3U3N0_9GAMM|nr:(2E,6E)-farnesyl diphosphate synthase [Candidatus Pantoea carbekii]AKC32245.1 geranyltranstransferase [Candidatus Pantoea carbekii]BAO00781.1 IspA protein [Candidatus Pantoea carbekii]